MSTMSVTEKLEAFSDALSHVALTGTLTFKELMEVLPKKDITEFKEVLYCDIDDIYPLIINDNGSINATSAKVMKANFTPVKRDKENGTVSVIIADSTVIIESEHDNYKMSAKDYPQSKGSIFGIFKSFFLFLKEYSKG